MKRLRKSFLSISIITLFLLIFAGITQSYAAIANPAVRYGVVSVRPDAGYGYLVSGNDKVWKIVEYNNASSNPAVIDYSKTIYCLKQGLGFGSGGIRPDPEYYDTYFDMKKDYGTMPANYKSMLPENYNEVLWLLDNIYVADGTESSKQEREALLAKVFKDDLEDDMLYPPFTMEDIVLTDSDMDVVQQLAIWYFTNPENDYLDNNINLYISPDELAQPNEFKILSDREFDDEDGYIRLEQANKYFSYLKREAVANASNYGDGAIREDNRRPIELSKTGIAVNKQGNNYIIGPYKINKITDADYTLNATFKEGSQAGQTFTDYTLLDQNQQPTSKTINELVGENFYISVPVTTDVETIVFTIDVEYYVRELQYWTVGDAPSTNQPIVIVKRIPKNYSDSVSVTIPKEEPEKIFDLSLRKFITAVNDEELRDAEGNLIREPQVDVSKLNNTVNGTYITTADYNHIKTPVSVKAGDIVTYTIRVYNEGEMAGYANEITDYLPPELEFLPEDALNKAYGWQLDPNDPSNRTVKTNYLSKETETSSGEHILLPFEKPNTNGLVQLTLDYKEVQIRCRVKTSNIVNQKITNIAEITEYKDAEGNPAIDRDSTQDNVNLPPDSNLPNYKDDEINSGIPYIPGQEDDDDFEKLVMQRFDLSLRKFITSVNGEELVKEDGTYLREPIVDVTPLKEGTSTTAIYNHSKIPVGVSIGDEVVYTIRVYNEGEVAGYANEIVDHLPPELEFLPDDELNRSYGWELDANDATGRTIKTKYLSYETDQEENLIDAFDKNTMDTLDYKEVKVKCKVKDVQETGKKITNIADITEYKDEDGNITVDIDSDAGNVVLPTDDNLPNYKDDEINSGADYIPGQEDDDDFEKLVMKKFDLSLRKFITAVNGEELQKEDGSYLRAPIVDVIPLVEGTGTTAIYNHTKIPVGVQVGDEVIYTIRVYNEGEVAGYANEIVDHLPPELEFLPDDELNKQYGWEIDVNDETGRTVRTKYLSHENDAENNRIDAFDKDTMTTLDYKDIKIKCRVRTTQETGKKITNIADITEYKDEAGKPAIDIDSEPDNVVLPPDTDLPNYKDDEINSGADYIPGQEDDDDFEKLVMKKFDLSLRKFITSVNGEELVDENGKYLREPVVDVTPLVEGTGTTAIYNHTKVPVGVKPGDIVVYTIRVYNEGEVAGYANEIVDHLPPELEFIINDDLNASYGWKLDPNDTSLRTIRTSILSYEYDEEENLIDGFDKDTMETLDYKEIKVKCKVKDVQETGKKITNIADITEYKDESGNIATDIDSKPDNVVLPPDSDLPNYKDDEINSGADYIPGQEDDDDFEKLKMQQFDLALRKFITKINDGDVTSRIPVVDASKLYTYVGGKLVTTATYTHPKDPILVSSGDTVVYTIRIYNEGDVAGYASEIMDDIPEGLEFLPENDTNITYRWKMLKEDGTETDNPEEAVKITTDYLSKEQEKNEGDNLIPGFDKSTMTEPAYKDVKVAFKVTEPNSSDRVIINTAEITDDTDEDGNPVEDIDSTPDNEEPEEDDIDIEKIKVVEFDLALRKFITAVNDTEITNRVPQVNIAEDGTISYLHTKEPVEVVNGNLVTYTLRIYNEGTMNGYAKEIKDDIPDGLEFVPDNSVNQEYRWKMLAEDGETEVTDVEDAKYVVTDYLSKEQETVEGGNMIPAFDRETMTEPAYKDVKVVFKVVEPNTSDRVLINTAEITDDSDEDGNDVVDKDSVPDNDNPEEDDIDIEKVKVKYFDLALKKWVTQAIVTQDGKTTVTETGHTGDENPEPIVKVDLHRNDINDVTVKFKYKIKVTNEGEIEGYVKEITDHIPDGLRFEAADNPKWTQVDDKTITTDQLKDTLLQPGESATVEVILTWINDGDNMGVMTNIAEISEDYNDSNTPDIDSTPGNEVPGEDDIDDAPVMLTVAAGEVPSYIGFGTLIVAILAGGIFLIKKYVFA